MTVLTVIIAVTRRRVNESRSGTDLRDLEVRAASHAPRGFRKALESVSSAGVAIIGELKKASPSRGLIRSDFDPAKFARDLRTFKVDLETAFRIADVLPHGVIAVTESGIESGADIARLRAAGYDAFLVGEALMKAQHPGEQLRSLVAEATFSAAGGS